MLQSLFTLSGKKKRKNQTNKNRTNKKNPIIPNPYQNNTRRLKMMNCSPLVKNKRINKNTCYPKEILFKIRNAYNESHLDKKIEENDPTKLLQLLTERLTTCEKEDCWLEQLKDANLKKKIDELIFSPDKPSEWLKNKNEWLSNVDIFEVLSQYEMTYNNFEFIGPTPIDFDTRLPDKDNKCVWEELCTISLEKKLKEGKDKIGIIFNLDRHDQGGSHWVSLFVDLKDRFIFYYDSAGNDIPKEIDALRERLMKQALELKKNKKMKMKFYKNYPVEHQHGNTECGMYSLFFIITMLTGVVEENTKLSLAKKIKLFKAGKIPDEYVEQYRNVYFN
jgi:hypothetical protein